MSEVAALLFLLLTANLALLLLVWRIYAPRIHVLIAKKGEKDQVLGESPTDPPLTSVHS